MRGQRSHKSVNGKQQQLSVQVPPPPPPILLAFVAPPTPPLGTLKQSNPQNIVCRELMRVHGVGTKTAKNWYNKGIRSVEEAQQTLLRDDDDEDDDGSGDGGA